jgi:two-component system, LytTR family, sensor kinase
MQRKQIILLHIIFWAAMLIVTGLEVIPAIGKTSVNYIAGDYIIYAVSYMFSFYLYYFFISKKHLNKKKITSLIILGLVFIFVITIPVTLIYLYFLVDKVFESGANTFLIEFRSYYFRLLETNFMFAISGALLKTALIWYDNILKQKEAEKQAIAGELALLRSQINPQFLFNTLTNIKSLIEKSPDKAIYSIESLSEIMNYMLYETSVERVLLNDEIKNINSYLNLQRIRYGKEYCLFEVSGDTNGISISPLLFMPFIENAFNYADGFNKNGGIKINLGVKENNLLFEVSGIKKETAEGNESGNAFSMNSIKRQLGLLYENNYNLDIKNENSNYFVELKINLSENNHTLN